MKFGLMVNTQDPPAAAHIVDRWQQILHIAEVAEQAGFDGVFLPEHHMMDDGYLPSQWGPLGALAARTKTIDIGTSVHLLPLENPVHVAEHSAMVDILSNGRLRLGCGMGNYAQEFELFGLNPKQQVSRFEESIELLQRAWTGEQIEHTGKHFNVHGHVSPRPVGAQLWLGGMSDAGVRRAARFGCTWITDPLHNIDVLSHWRGVYEEAGAKCGTEQDLGISLMRYAWVADSMDEVERDWWPHMQSLHWFYFSQVGRFVKELEPTLANVKGEEDFHFAQHRRDRLVVGTPDDCIAMIERLRQRLNPAYLIMIFRAGTGPDFERELTCLKRFGQDVISAYRNGGSAAPA